MNDRMVAPAERLGSRWLRRQLASREEERRRTWAKGLRGRGRTFGVGGMGRGTGRHAAESPLFGGIWVRPGSLVIVDGGDLLGLPVSVSAAPIVWVVVVTPFCKVFLVPGFRSSQEVSWLCDGRGWDVWLFSAWFSDGPFLRYKCFLMVRLRNFVGRWCFGHTYGAFRIEYMIEHRKSHIRASFPVDEQTERDCFIIYGLLDGFCYCSEVLSRPLKSCRFFDRLWLTGSRITHVVREMRQLVFFTTVRGVQQKRSFMLNQTVLELFWLRLSANV